MPDDNRFANISVDEDEAEEETDEVAEEPAETTETTEPDPTMSSEEPTPTEPATQDESPEPATSPKVDAAEAGPAFEFADVQQKAIYPLPDTWQSYQDFLDFEVRRQLREYDITDETGRELDEAALRVLQNHAQEIADEVVALREERQ